MAEEIGGHQPLIGFADRGVVVLGWHGGIDPDRVSSGLHSNTPIWQCADTLWQKDGGNPGVRAPRVYFSGYISLAYISLGYIFRGIFPFKFFS